MTKWSVDLVSWHSLCQWRFLFFFCFLPWYLAMPPLLTLHLEQPWICTAFQRTQQTINTMKDFVGDFLINIVLRLGESMRKYNSIICYYLFLWRCGICGDAWDANPRQHENPGGKFANGIIVRAYQPGEDIKVTVLVTANHKVNLIRFYLQYQRRKPHFRDTSHSSFVRMITLTKILIRAALSRKTLS